MSTPPSKRLGRVGVPEYNPLLDRNLRGFFSSPGVQAQLVRVGIVTEDGKILNPDAHGVRSQQFIAEEERKRRTKERTQLEKEERELRERVHKLRVQQLEEDRRMRIALLTREHSRIREEIVTLSRALAEPTPPGSLECKSSITGAAPAHGTPSPLDSRAPRGRPEAGRPSAEEHDTLSRLVEWASLSTSSAAASTHARSDSVGDASMRSLKLQQSNVSVDVEFGAGSWIDARSSDAASCAPVGMTRGGSGAQLLAGNSTAPPVSPTLLSLRAALGNVGSSAGRGGIVQSPLYPPFSPMHARTQSTSALSNDSPQPCRVQSSSCDETRNDGASTAHRRTSSWLLHAHGAPATPQPETGLRDSAILAIVDSTLQAHGIPAIGPSLLAARNSAQLPCSPMRSPPLSTDNRWVAPLSSPTAATRTEATDAPHAHHSVHTSSAPASEAHSAHAASPPGHHDVLGMAEQSRRGGAPSSAPLAQMAVSNVEARQGSLLASGSTGSSPTAAWPAEHTSAHTIHARQRLSFDGSVEEVHTPASPMTASLAEGYRSFMPQAGTMAAWGLRTSMSMYSRSRAAMPHTGSTASTSTELPVDVNNTARSTPLAGLPTPEGGESGGMVHNSAANAKQYVHASRVLEMPACAVDAYSCAPL